VNSLKNKLRDWYGPSKIEDSINQEYCKYFFYLFCDCMEILIDLHKDHAYHIGLEEGKSETRQLILKLLIEELKEMENGTEIFAKIESIIRRK